MTEKKKVLKKKAAPAPKKSASRATIRKYCEIKKLGRGETLVFGSHTYRVNKPLDSFTDAECDKILKNMGEIGFDAHVAQAKKGIAGKHPAAVTTTESKPCECGCKAMTRKGSRFLPGHDMKLKSALRKAGTAASKKELRARGWA